MYSSERIQWWLGRSSSEEYRQAYRNVASMIPVGSERILDVGCGEGRLLNIIHSYHKRLFGTDSSQEMLDRSKLNLRELTPPAVLIQDNFFFSRLPSSYFDRTLLTFPDLMFKGDFSDEESKLADKLIDLLPEDFRRENRDSLGNFLPGLLMNYQLSRVTEMNGYVVTARYDISEGGNAEAGKIESVEKEGVMFGLELESERFFEEPRVWGDTHDKDYVHEVFPDSRKGYRVFVFRKNKDLFLFSGNH